MNNVLEWLDNSARSYSSKVAFCDSEGNEITFKDLNYEIETIGSNLICCLKKTKSPIVVLTERNIKSISAFWGVVYSGNFYLPIDASLPENRINDMIALAKPIAIINCSDRVFNSDSVKIFNVEELKCCTNKMTRINLIQTDPLYGIFTSGSTGFPKLVLKNHLSIISFVNEYVKTFGFKAEDTQGNQIPFYFDASTKDLFTTIKVGCTTNIINKSYFSWPGKLANYLVDNKITSICWVPSALSMLSLFNVFEKIDLSQIKRVLFVGEPMPTKQLNIWYKALPKTQFINLYGSTENAGNCLYYVLNHPLNDEERVPIGKEFCNCNVLLLDDNEKLIEKSDTTSIGEICVLGDILSLGYYQNFEATSEKFCQNPLNDKYYERMFKTGDVGQYDVDGNIVCLGRKDYQIKLNGYRIELGDIDVKALTMEGVTSACSIYDAPKKKIVLYYSGAKDLGTELVRFLKDKLPSYMVPSKYIYLKAMPLNKNGKIDRNLLKENYFNR